MSSSDTERADLVKHNGIMYQQKKKEKSRDLVAHWGYFVLESSLASSLKVRGMACISRLLADIVFVG